MLRTYKLPRKEGKQCIYYYFFLTGKYNNASNLAITPILLYFQVALVVQQNVTVMGRRVEARGQPGTELPSAHSGKVGPAGTGQVWGRGTAPGQGGTEGLPLSLCF